MTQPFGVVFDSCFRTKAWEEEEYKAYLCNTVTQFQETYPESSIMIFNFHEGDTKRKIHHILFEYYITIMDYPKHYEGCPLLTMEVIHHFIKSSESWLSLGQQNVLLIHCELGGWPVLAFMLAALLLSRKVCTSENRALEMVHKRAPKKDILPMMSSLNPLASQLRIFARDPLLHREKSPKLLFSTPRRRPNARSYNQAENKLVKIDINCDIQGDVVLECIHLDDDMMKETIMYRVIFNTAYIKSNTLILNHDEIDVCWDAKDRVPKDFKAEISFSEKYAITSMVPVDLSRFKEEGIPMEAFGKVQQMLSSVDWLVRKGFATLNGQHQTALSDIVNQVLETSFHRTESSNLH
ncbi:hypothetical protein L1887_12083 [Cichorium endivia]|nr:hypothetical protein L1887_12083 [Cichorium endivia]